MLYVKVGKNKSIEKAISIFKRKVKESGLNVGIKRKVFYKNHQQTVEKRK